MGHDRRSRLPQPFETLEQTGPKRCLFPCRERKMVLTGENPRREQKKIMGHFLATRLSLPSVNSWKYDKQLSPRRCCRSDHPRKKTLRGKYAQDRLTQGSRAVHRMRSEQKEEPREGEALPHSVTQGGPELRSRGGFTDRFVKARSHDGPIRTAGGPAKRGRKSVTWGPPSSRPGSSSRRDGICRQEARPEGKTQLHAVRVASMNRPSRSGNVVKHGLKGEPLLDTSIKKE